jgi:hypothetical protein
MTIGSQGGAQAQRLGITFIPAQGKTDTFTFVEIRTDTHDNTIVQIILSR